MEITGILTAIAVGAVIGVLGRLLLPGRQRIGILPTLAVGIVAALIGTAIASGIGVDGSSGVDWTEVLLQVVLAAAGVALLDRAKARA